MSDLAERADRAAPHGVADLAGAVGRFAPLLEPGGERIRVRAPTGRGVRQASRSDASAQRCRRSRAGRGGRRPTTSAGRRRAGPRRDEQLAVGRREAAFAEDARVADRSAGRRGRPAPRADPPSCRRTSPATADRREPVARGPTRSAPGSSRPSSRRSGRVSVAPDSPCGRAASSPRSHGPRLSSSRSRGERRQRRPRGPVSSRSRRGPGSRCATIGPVSRPSSIRISVTPVSRSPAKDRRRDRRRATMARQQRRVEVQGPVRQVEQRGRDDLAVVGEHHERRSQGQDGRQRIGRAQPFGGQDREAMRGCGRDLDLGRGRWRGPGRPAAPERSPRPPVRCRDDRRVVPSDGRPNPPLPRKTVRTREPPARPSVTRGRSSPRGPRRRPRCPRRPPSAHPSTRGSRCRACRRGGRARAATPARAGRIRRP